MKYFILVILIIILLLIAKKIEYFSSYGVILERDFSDLIKDESGIFFSEQTTYKEGRRRINCTSKFNGEWYWFGHQILIK